MRMMRQKFCGLAILAVGIFSAVVLDGDISFALCAVPIGSCLMLSKRIWVE